MKSKFCCLNTLCLVLVFLFLLPLSVFAEEGGMLALAEDSFYYGRSALAQMNNSTALLYAYDRIVEGTEVCKEEIDVYDGIHSINSSEVIMVMDAYRRDHTEHFWVNSGFSYLPSANGIVSVYPNYTMSGSALTTARQKFDAAIDAYLVGVTPSMSDYEKELYFHDRLAENVTYVETTHAHDAYGALVEGQAVCEGYAEALQCLLHEVSIRSFQAYGNAGGPHAWNYVEIDGAFYHTDLTWNDQESRTYHVFFNVTDEKIRSMDHSIDSEPYPLPECNSTADNYFVQKGLYFSSYDVESIGNALKENGFDINLYVEGGSDGFISWYEANIGSIAAAADLYTGFSYGYQGWYGELFLYLNPHCSHTNLSYSSYVSPSCGVAGRKAYYTCSCGMRFWDAAAQEVVKGKDPFTVAPLTHSYDDDSDPYCNLCSAERSVPGFWGAGVTLENDLTLTFYADKAQVENLPNLSASFVMGDRVETVTEYVDKSGYYIFSLKNIAPQFIGEKVSATLYANFGGVKIGSNSANFSIADYCAKVLANETSSLKLKTLCVDLLRYGSAAQIFENYKVESLVDATLSPEQAALGTQGAPASENVTNTKFATVENPKASWVNAALNLREAVAFRLQFTAENVSNLRVEIRDIKGNLMMTLTENQLEKSGNTYTALFRCTMAGEMSKSIFVTVMDGDTPVSNTLRYSVESYVSMVHQYYTDEKLIALVNALFNYGNAANAYANT